MIRWGWIGLILGAAASLAIGLAVQAGGFSFYGTLAAFMGWSPLPRLWMVLGLAALLVAYAPATTGWLGERFAGCEVRADLEAVAALQQRYSGQCKHQHWFWRFRWC